jgi:hypothetical protein
MSTLCGKGLLALVTLEGLRQLRNNHVRGHLVHTLVSEKVLLLMWRRWDAELVQTLS